MTKDVVTCSADELCSAAARKMWDCGAPAAPPQEPGMIPERILRYLKASRAAAALPPRARARA